VVERINRLLAEMGSLFHTDDGVKLVRHCGGLRFLVRRFDTPEDCLAYVQKAKEVSKV